MTLLQKKKKKIQPKREVIIDVLKDLQLIITKLG